MVKSGTVQIVVEEVPISFSLSIGAIPQSGRLGDNFEFVGILTQNGFPAQGISINLVFEGVGVVGSDVTGANGDYSITWTADRVGTLSFHAENLFLGASSPAISALVRAEGGQIPVGIIFLGLLALAALTRARLG